MDNEFVFLSGTTSKRAKQTAKENAKANGTSLVSELNKIAFDEARMSWSEVSKLYTSIPKPRLTLNGLFDILDKYPIGLNTTWFLDNENALKYEKQRGVSVDFGDQIANKGSFFDDRNAIEWCELLEVINLMCYFWDEFKKSPQEVSLDQSSQVERGLSLIDAFDLFMNSYAYDYTAQKRFGQTLVKNSNGELKKLIIDEINSNGGIRIGCLFIAAIHCGFNFELKVDLTCKDYTDGFDAKLIPIIDCLYTENIFFKTKQYQDADVLAKSLGINSGVNPYILDKALQKQFTIIDENFNHVRSLFSGHFKKNN